MKKRAAIPAVVILSLFLLLLPALAEAQTTAKIPQWTLKDAGGEVVGHVVGFQSSGVLAIAMDDPAFDSDFPILVTYNNGFVLQGPADRVFYTGAVTAS